MFKIVLSKSNVLNIKLDDEGGGGRRMGWTGGLIRGGKEAPLAPRLHGCGSLHHSHHSRRGRRVASGSAAARCHQGHVACSAGSASCDNQEEVGELATVEAGNGEWLVAEAEAARGQTTINQKVSAKMFKIFL